MLAAKWCVTTDINEEELWDKCHAIWIRRSEAVISVIVEEALCDKCHAIILRRSEKVI